MVNDSEERPTIDWASLPSGFRERFLILLLTGLLFTSYLTATVWIVAEQHWNDPARPVIFTGDITSLKFVLLGIFVFLSTAFIIYLLHPISARRQFGAGRPLDPDTTLGRLASELTSQLELSPVAFTVTGDLRNQQAIALGFPGRRQVRFGGGMRLVVSKDAMLARAVAAHELGHLRHRDVDLGHLTRGVAWATACLAGLTVIIQLTGLVVFLSAPRNATTVANLWNNFWHGRIPAFTFIQFAEQWEPLYGVSFGFLLSNLAFFFVVLYLEYAAALRSREHYADIFADSLVGSDAVQRLFGDGRTRQSTIRNLFRKHPDSARRYRVLAQPDLVVRPTILQSLASGYLAGLFIVYVTTYTTNIRPSGNRWATFILPQCCDADELANALHNNPLFLARLILFSLASLLTLILVGSLNLRLVTSAGILKKSRVWLFAATVALAVPFGAGLLLGEYLNPLALWRRLNEFPTFGGPTEFIVANPKVAVCLLVAVGVANQLIYSRNILEPGGLRSRLLRFIALPVWVVFVYLLSLTSVAFAPMMKGPGPNRLETAIQNYQQREAKIDAIFRDAQDKVAEGDRSAPDVAVGFYTSARNNFDLILDHYPDSRSAAAIRGGNGNPITLSLVEERLRGAECAARPARVCLMQLAHDDAFSELTMGLKTALPQFGLAAVGSVMAANKALGNEEGAQDIARQVLEQLAPIPLHSVAFMTSGASLLQLANALAFVGNKENGMETYQRIVGDAPPASAVLLMRVLSATKAEIEPLRSDIEALPTVQRFYFLVDLARRTRELNAQAETKSLVDEALSIMPAGAPALYIMDVAVSRDDARMIWKQISAGIDLRSVPPPWLPVALRYETLLGDTTTALDFARALPDGSARARALFEIAIAQAQEGKDGVDQILEQADASANPMRSPDPALALVAVEAHAWAGDATTAVTRSRKMANQAYRALALARIACALSKLRHPFLFFANRPPL